MEIKWTGDGYPHMNIKENKGVTYLTFPALEKEEGFVHGFQHPPGRRERRNLRLHEPEFYQGG